MKCSSRIFLHTILFPGREAISQLILLELFPVTTRYYCIKRIMLSHPPSANTLILVLSMIPSRNNVLLVRLINLSGSANKLESSTARRCPPFSPPPRRRGRQVIMTRGKRPEKFHRHIPSPSRCGRHDDRLLREIGVKSSTRNSFLLFSASFLL